MPASSRPCAITSFLWRLTELPRPAASCCAMAPVRYRLGDKFLRREVPVYYLAPAPERGQG